MARQEDGAAAGSVLLADCKAEAKLILYHWTHSFCSQKVSAWLLSGVPAGISTWTDPSRLCRPVWGVAAAAAAQWPSCFAGPNLDG